MSQKDVTRRSPGTLAPGSHPMCLATRAGFQNSQHLLARPPRRGTAQEPGAPAHHLLFQLPAPWPGASKPTDLAPPRRRPAGLEPRPPPVAPSRPSCITPQGAGGLGLRDRILDKQSSGPGGTLEMRQTWPPPLPSRSRCCCRGPAGPRPWGWGRGCCRGAVRGTGAWMALPQGDCCPRTFCLPRARAVVPA